MYCTQVVPHFGYVLRTMSLSCARYLKSDSVIRAPETAKNRSKHLDETHLKHEGGEQSF